MSAAEQVIPRVISNATLEDAGLFTRGKQEEALQGVAFIMRIIETVHRRFDRLQRDPVTKLDFLLGTVEPGIDFQGLDRAQELIDKFVRELGGDTLVEYRCALNALHALAEHLASTLAMVEPLRKFAKARK